MTDELYEKQRAFLDNLKEELGCEGDVDLAWCMGVATPVISKFYAGTMPIGLSFIVAVHELTGIPTKDIKETLGWPPSRVTRVPRCSLYGRKVWTINPKYAGEK